MKGMNPFLPLHEHVPDGEPRLFDGRVYLYGSHDSRHGTYFCSEDYVCWSAPAENLCDWRYDGVIYKKEQDPYNPDGKKCMFAPDVVQGPDGRYYLYYALDSMSQISVAVCDTPNGKYEFYGMVGWKNQDGSRKILTEPSPFDPGVLVENEKVYLYFGFCMKVPDSTDASGMNEEGSVVCELESDMITVKGELKYLIPSWKTSKGTGFEGHEFYEASSIRKVNEKYYFIYSSILSHELCYAVSDYPDRDFVYGGTIVSNGDIGLHGRNESQRTAYTGNTHGSILCIQGQWYVFYHRHTEGNWCCRQACAERIQIQEDGSISQVEITSSGLYGRPLPAEETYNSGICCNLVSCKGAVHIDINREADKSLIPYVYEDGDGYVSNIQDGTNIGYKYFLFTGKEKEMRLRIRGKALGTFRVFIDGGTKEWLTGIRGTEIGTAPIRLYPGKWEDISIKINPTQGCHSLYMVYEGEGSLDWREFSFR